MFTSDSDEGFQALPEDIRTEIYQQVKHDIENDAFLYMAGSLIISVGKNQFYLHVKDIFTKDTEYDVKLQYLISKSYVKFKKPSHCFYATALKNIEIFESTDIDTIISYCCL